MSAEAVSAAEEALSTRAVAHTGRRSGLGLWSSCWRILQLLRRIAFTVYVAMTVSQPNPPGDGLLFGNWTTLAIVIGLMQFTVGLLLFIGGQRFRKLSDRGRRHILLAIRIVQAYVLGLSVLFVLDFAVEAAKAGEWAGAIFIALVACGSGALYLWLLQLAVRYLRSSFVSSLCVHSRVAA